MSHTYLQLLQRARSMSMCIDADVTIEDTDQHDTVIQTATYRRGLWDYVIA